MKKGEICGQMKSKRTYLAALIWLLLKQGIMILVFHDSTKNRGRHVDPDMLLSLEKLCTWLECEGDAELYTLAELHAKMSALSPEFDVYSIKRLKQKLIQHYGQFLFFTEVEGRGTVVFFRNLENFINKKSYSEKKADDQGEIERIIHAAAKIIRAEIREHKYDTTLHPGN